MVGIWPENASVVEAFLSVASQWRATSIGGGLEAARVLYIGLDYTAARAGLDAGGLIVTPELWQGVRLMEAAARDTLNGIEG